MLIWVWSFHGALLFDDMAGQPLRLSSPGGQADDQDDQGQDQRPRRRPAPGPRGSGVPSWKKMASGRVAAGLQRAKSGTRSVKPAVKRTEAASPMPRPKAISTRGQDARAAPGGRRPSGPSRGGWRPSAGRGVQELARHQADDLVHGPGHDRQDRAGRR